MNSQFGMSKWDGNVIDKRKRQRVEAPSPGDWQFLIAVGFIAAVFAMGGGSRADIVSLSYLRPLAAFVMVAGVMSVRWKHLRQYRLEVLVMLAALALVLVQLVPLPPYVWQALPGRSILVEIDRWAGLGKTWRPLTMDPPSTRNAFMALIVPAALLVTLLPLSGRHHSRLLGVVLGIGAIDALLSLLQVLGPAGGPLYFYEITNSRWAVGLFANRNHNAMFLASLFPLIAAWWGSQDLSLGSKSPRNQLYWRLLPAISFTLLLVLLVLLTGSRSGSALAFVALALSPLVLLRTGGTPEAHRHNAKVVRISGLIAAFAACLAALAIWLGRAEAIDRFFVKDPIEDLRVILLPALLAMLATYLPWGSGLGTFDPVFRMHEPDALLDPTYVNHVHNDWLELALTGGAPALLIAGVAMVGLTLRLRRAWMASTDRSGAVLARASLLSIALLAAGSITDYPLRVPSLSCLFVLLAFWTHRPQLALSDDTFGPEMRIRD